jgi:hypothetical protein
VYVKTEDTRLNLLKQSSINAKPKEITIAWQDINVNLNEQPSVSDLAKKICNNKDPVKNTQKQIIKNGRKIFI